MERVQYIANVVYRESRSYTDRSLIRESITKKSTFGHKQKTVATLV